MTFRMKSLIAFLAILVLAGAGAWAQTATHNITFDVTGFSSIQVQSSAAINLTVSDGGTPGADPVGSTDNTKYLQYTVITSTSVSIGVTLASVTDSIPAGCELHVTATPESSPAHGVSGGEITLVMGANAGLVTAIPSCATGSTATDGARLLFELVVVTPANLDPDDNDNEISVTYTIS
jgi:hypothetical protein